MRILLLVVCWSLCICSAQEYKSTSIEFSMQTVPQDFFATLQFSHQKNRLKGHLGIGLGLNRSVFQQRFYPSQQIGFNYYFLQKSRFQLGASVLLQSQTVKLLASSTHMTSHYFTGFGYQLDWGNKVRFTHGLHLGPQLESYYNTYLGHTSNLFFVSYSFQFGVKYAF